MRSMLDQRHADRRQLPDLVAPAPACGPTLIVAELMAATNDTPRVVSDDLINLILRDQLAARGPVPVLPASFTLDAVPGQQLLRLQTSLRPPLPTRVWPDPLGSVRSL